MNKLRKTSLLFFVFQLADLIMTFVGINLGLQEGNFLVSDVGIGNLFLCKLTVMIIIPIVLQIKKYYKTDWIFPIISGIVLPNNFLLILNIMF